ncbi:hypothetical protein HIV01_015335 [Lysobacter arenosi]|uniref:Uncharacterized protein n=1 Tax=Lysobacter arenosi TaxID=2795387 RepID=A0ABX7R976_9GAMM|nr:hypothetical protein [Lysobacter arenosi]QSX74535.1 hypothetical protein HIV01_015335 [Lysobacter arenosi]
MKDGDIDYSKYERHELEEALERINADLYPRNHANLRSAYQALVGKQPPPPNVPRLRPEPAQFEDEPPPVPKYDEHGRYVPNHIPAGERLSLVALSLLLLTYGSYGVWTNDLYLPARRGGIHLNDSSAWAMLGAFACAFLCMLVLVADHYDRRNNELNYWRASRVVGGLGWSCFVLSLILWIFQRFHQ